MKKKFFRCIGFIIFIVGVIGVIISIGSTSRILLSILIIVAGALCWVLNEEDIKSEEATEKH